MANICSLNIWFDYMWNRVSVLTQNCTWYSCRYLYLYYIRSTLRTFPAHVRAQLNTTFCTIQYFSVEHIRCVYTMQTHCHTKRMRAEMKLTIDKKKHMKGSNVTITKKSQHLQRIKRFLAYGIHSLIKFVFCVCVLLAFFFTLNHLSKLKNVMKIHKCICRELNF